jgi:hypothetical protein
VQGNQLQIVGGDDGSFACGGGDDRLIAVEMQVEIKLSTSSGASEGKGTLASLYVRGNVQVAGVSF